MDLEELETIKNIIYKGGTILIAVGIDISKNKSTIAILNSDCSIRDKPFNMNHNQTEINIYKMSIFLEFC